MKSSIKPKSVFQLLAFTDKEFKPFLDYLSYIGSEIDLTGDVASLTGITDYELFTVDKVVSLAALGGEIEGYPVWVEVDDLDTDAPDTVGGGKWSEVQSKPRELNGKFYVRPSVTGSQIIQLLADGDPAPFNEST